MAYIQDGRTVAGQNAVENKTKSARSTLAPRGNAYGISGTTGTIAAALAANSSIFAMRIDPTSGNTLAFIERVRVQFTSIVAFTVPVTAGRRLGLYRSTTTAFAPSGGTTIAAPIMKDSTGPVSEFANASGGAIQIATTGALTMTSIVFELQPFKEISLTHVGAAGANHEQVWEFHASESAPVVLQPGQVLAIRNPVAFDAAGTWQATISVDWHESVAWNSTVAD